MVIISCLERAFHFLGISEERQTHLIDEGRAWKAPASRPLHVPASHGRTACWTVVQLAFGTVTVLPPRCEKRCRKEPLLVWAIRVWEERTPAGEEPLEWILLTSVPTTTLEQECRARCGMNTAGSWRTIDYLKLSQNRMPSGKAPGASRRPFDPEARACCRHWQSVCCT